MYIFDQFAHSVDHIQLETTSTVLQDLVHHLTIFAANLAVIQQDNHIPITFRQYCIDASHYHQVLVDHSYLGESNVAQITRRFLSHSNNGTGGSRLSNLDDPPFERLRQWQVRCTDHPTDSKSGEGGDCIVQLESLVSFLSGSQVINNTPVAAAATITPIIASPSHTSASSPTSTPHIMAGQKRTQDKLDPSNRQRQRLVSPPRASSLYV
jgi:hypothetical protein